MCDAQSDARCPQSRVARRATAGAATAGAGQEGGWGEVAMMLTEVPAQLQAAVRAPVVFTRLDRGMCIRSVPNVVGGMKSPARFDTCLDSSTTGKSPLFVSSQRCPSLR